MISAVVSWIARVIGPVVGSIARLFYALGALVYEYRSLIVGASASAVVAWYVADLMRRLDRREHDAIGSPAAAAAIAFPVMLLAFGWGTQPGIPKSHNTPYVVALLTLVLAAGIWAVLRWLDEPAKAPDISSSPRTGASPSVVLLAVSAILVGVLWMIEVAVANTLHRPGASPPLSTRGCSSQPLLGPVCWRWRYYKASAAFFRSAEHSTTRRWSDGSTSR